MLVLPIHISQNLEKQWHLQLNVPLSILIHQMPVNSLLASWNAPRNPLSFDVRIVTFYILFIENPTCLQYLLPE